jgi:hypothetical protein
MAVTTYRGPVRATSAETDGQFFISALEGFYTGTATMSHIRGAAGDVFLRRATSDTAFVVTIPLHQILKKIGTDPQTSVARPDKDDAGAARLRGFLCNSIDVVHRTTTADLTTFTYDLHRTTMTAGAAASVASTIGGTLSGSMTVTNHATFLNVDRITCGTPFVIGGNTAAVADYLELSVDPATTSVWEFYGVYVNCSYNLL